MKNAASSFNVFFLLLVGCSSPDVGSDAGISLLHPHPFLLVPTSTSSSSSPATGGCVINGLHHLPDPALTPGKLCSPTDPDFHEYRYPSHMPYCTRGVNGPEKDRVANAYGVPKSDYSLYEFDHLIPLSCGGANDDTNIWPQPIAEAWEKDKVEDKVYWGLRNGTMTQEEGLALLKDWRPSGVNCGDE
jgi:hypothetical protein